MSSQALRAPVLLIAVAFGGAMAALVGGYWDDAWHTERGRDAFLIAPHIAIYAGIASAGGALALWALLAARTRGIAAVWRHGPLALALISVGVTLASGPIDNAWHVAFGRDAVIWSPPHMLGIAGTFALGAALLAELTGRPEPWAGPVAGVAGALVLASAGFAVAEYDTDVPQFDVSYYLPVLGFAAGIGLVLVRTASSARWAATLSSVVYTLFIAAVGGFLALLDFPPPALPLIVLAGVLVDIAARRAWTPLASATAITVALHLAYVPTRNLLGDGVRFDAGDVVVGAAMTWVATLVVFTLAGGRTAFPTLRGPATGTAVCVLLVVMHAAPALAHDPGQGEHAGTVAMGVIVKDSRARVTVDVPPAQCAATDARAVVGRRAGVEVRGSLVKRGCRLRGEVRLPARGRWFVYAEMRRDGRSLESWVPVSVRSGAGSASELRRYAYVPPRGSAGALKVVGGATLYAGMLALLYAALVLVRPAPLPAAS